MINKSGKAEGSGGKLGARSIEVPMLQHQGAQKPGGATGHSANLWSSSSDFICEFTANFSPVSEGRREAEWGSSGKPTRLRNPLSVAKVNFAFT